VYAVLGVAEHGWASQRTLGLAAISAVALVVFLVRQARIATPLMPLRLFASRDVTGANLVMALLVVGMFGLFFLGALYLQLVLGYDPLAVGLAFLPSTLVMGVTSLKLSQHFAPRMILVPSLLLIVAGLLLFARTPADGSYVRDVLPATILIGLGAGLSTPALMALAMSGVNPEDAGLASGLVNTTVQVGGAIGLAVLATLAAGRTGTSTAPDALLSGYHLAFVVGAGLLLIATLVALWLCRPRSVLQIFGVRDVISPDRV
jgi:predicted MFS family arabinose efflux permease